METVVELKNNTNLVKDLFKKRQPSNSALWAYLGGDIPGRTFVDNLASPTKAICMINWTWAWASDDADVSWIEEAVHEICKSTWLNLIWNTKERPQKPLKGVKVAISRVEFIGLAKKIVPPQLENVEIKLIDDALFEKCLWKEDRIVAYGSKEKFLEKAYGFCAVQDNEVCCESCSSFVVNGHTEMGVVTAENKRRQGFALATCLRVIEETLKRGLIPTWSTDKENFESANLAKKLGFKDPSEYEILYFPQND